MIFTHQFPLFSRTIKVATTLPEYKQLLSDTLKLSDYSIKSKIETINPSTIVSTCSLPDDYKNNGVIAGFLCPNNIADPIESLSLALQIAFFIWSCYVDNARIVDTLAISRIQTEIYKFFIEEIFSIKSSSDTVESPGHGGDTTTEAPVF